MEYVIKDFCDLRLEALPISEVEYKSVLNRLWNIGLVTTEDALIFIEYKFYGGVE